MDLCCLATKLQQYKIAQIAKCSVLLAGLSDGREILCEMLLFSALADLFPGFFGKCLKHVTLHKIGHTCYIPGYITN